MSIQLPDLIDRYFAAPAGDAEALGRCFAENAVVKDEGHRYQGLAAIQRWRAETAGKYTFTSEPIACENKDGKTIVTSRVTGNFPGSPVVLRYFFGLDGNRIASLEIIP